MQINLIAVGKNMSTWVNEGYQTYAARLPADYRLNLIEINAQKRQKNADITKIVAQECENVLAAIPANTHTIALDRLGKSITTHVLTQQLQQWHDHSIDISLLIGGPEGLNKACLQRADQCWSLSPLTLPHPLVRVVVAEQLYRAFSIITGHPYHR